MQKKRREEILRLKEQRRIIMAHQRRKQMMASQQQQHLSEDVTQNGMYLKRVFNMTFINNIILKNNVSVTFYFFSESLIPLITGISTPLVKPVTSVPTNNSTIGKKRIVVRRVPCRGYHLLRKKPNICTNKEELSSHSTVTTRQIIDHVSI